MFRHRLAAIAILMIAVSSISSMQGRPDFAALMAAQVEAMKRVSSMDGAWRGPTWTILPSGEKHTIVQTERVGPFLGGSVKVIEGRGYEADGSVSFNAFAILEMNLTRVSDTSWPAAGAIPPK